MEVHTSKKGLKSLFGSSDEAFVKRWTTEKELEMSDTSWLSVDDLKVWGNYHARVDTLYKT